MMETTLEEDLHYLNEIIGTLTDEEIDEIILKAENINVSARYYVEEFTSL